MEKLRHCILGGTFTYVHDGHWRMLRECRGFGKITLGLTTDAYVRKHKIYPSFPYAARLVGVKSALAKLGLLARTEIIQINDEAGGADSNRGADTIIVSEETQDAARRINTRRKKHGLPALKIISVPLAYGQDLKKISAWQFTTERQI